MRLCIARNLNSSIVSALAPASAFEFHSGVLLFLLTLSGGVLACFFSAIRGIYPIMRAFGALVIGNAFAW